MYGLVHPNRVLNNYGSHVRSEIQLQFTNFVMLDLRMWIEKPGQSQRILEPILNFRGDSS